MTINELAIKMDLAFENTHALMEAGFAKATERADALEQNMDLGFKDVYLRMEAGFKRADKRIDAVEEKMDVGFKKANERMDVGFKKANERMDTFEERFEALMITISNFANQVEARFDSVESTLEEHGSQLLGVEGRLYKIEVILEQHEVRFEGFGRQFLELSFKHDQVINSVDGLVKLITDGEVENAARDHKIQRLETLVFTNRPLPLPPL